MAFVIGQKPLIVNLENELQECLPDLVLNSVRFMVIDQIIHYWLAIQLNAYRGNRKYFLPWLIWVLTKWLTFLRLGSKLIMRETLSRCELGFKPNFVFSFELSSSKRTTSPSKLWLLEHFSSITIKKWARNDPNRKKRGRFCVWHKKGERRPGAYRRKNILCV